MTAKFDTYKLSQILANSLFAGREDAEYMADAIADEIAGMIDRAVEAVDTGE